MVEEAVALSLLIWVSTCGSLGVSTEVSWERMVVMPEKKCIWLLVLLPCWKLSKNWLIWQLKLRKKGLALVIAGMVVHTSSRHSTTMKIVGQASSPDEYAGSLSRQQLGGQDCWHTQQHTKQGVASSNTTMPSKKGATNTNVPAPLICSYLRMRSSLVLTRLVMRVVELALRQADKDLRYIQLVSLSPCWIYQATEQQVETALSRVLLVVQSTLGLCLSQRSGGEENDRYCSWVVKAKTAVATSTTINVEQIQENCLFLFIYRCIIKLFYQGSSIIIIIRPPRDKEQLRSILLVPALQRADQRRHSRASTFDLSPILQSDRVDQVIAQVLQD